MTNTTSTLIDPILSNSKYVKECNVVDLRLSDHSLVHIRRDYVKINRPHKTITSRSYKNFNKENFLEDLEDVDRSNVLSASCLDDAANAFNENVLKVLDKHAPSTTKRIRFSNPPWVDEYLLQSIKEQGHLKKKASRSGLPQDWTIFKRNSVNSLKDQLVSDYYQTTLTDNKQNSNKLWKTLNNIMSW